MSAVEDDAKVLTALLAAYGPVECERLSRRATRWRLGALPTSGEGYERLRELCEQHAVWLEELAQLEVAEMCPDTPASARHCELIELTGVDQLERFAVLLAGFKFESRAQACVRCTGSPIASALLRAYPIAVDPKPRG